MTDRDRHLDPVGTHFSVGVPQKAIWWGAFLDAFENTGRALVRKGVGVDEASSPTPKRTYSLDLQIPGQ